MLNDPYRTQHSRQEIMSEYSAVRVGKLKLKGGKGTLGKKRKRKRDHSRSDESEDGPLKHGE